MGLAEAGLETDMYARLEVTYEDEEVRWFETNKCVTEDVLLRYIASMCAYILDHGEVESVVVHLFGTKGV